MEVRNNFHMIILYILIIQWDIGYKITNMEKQVLSVKLDMNLYWQLKSEVGKGKISRFVEGLIARELNKQDQKLAQEYQEAAKDKKR
ncbi:MAG TPA: hypothetical protein VM682_02535 [Bacillus sp. (in: firmicutes)]|jgi:hypothetical protein|nr:hypothetical protein [Bacillus sp. (in: firmicutes)]